MLEKVFLANFSAEVIWVILIKMKHQLDQLASVVITTIEDCQLRHAAELQSMDSKDDYEKLALSIY